MTVTCTSAFDSDTGSNFKETPRGRALLKTGGSNHESSKACKRGDSFVRDGYIITIEEIYHVNGRKKKKVKKRRL